MGGQQLLESQGAKKTRMENSSQAPVPGTLFCLYLWDIFSFFFLLCFLKIQKKYRQLIVWLLGFFLTVFSPFGSKGMGFAVQHLKECNTNTFCSLERKLLIFYALILRFSELLKCRTIFKRPAKAVKYWKMGAVSHNNSIKETWYQA